MVKEMCERKDIEYFGTVNRETKTRLLGTSQAVVLPFRKPEAYSVLSVEAQLMGTPVLAIEWNDGVPKTHSFDSVSVLMKRAAFFVQGDKANAEKTRVFCERRWGFAKMIQLYREAVDDVLQGVFW